QVKDYITGVTTPAEMGGTIWGNVSARLKAALKWAKSQHGKPYQWGGGGNPSLDCAGFMAGIQKKIHGQNPRGRLYTTFDFRGKRAPKGWVQNLDSPFTVGVTNKGVGHMAGTLIGTNVESAGGGKGVRVGKTARGTMDKMFTARYGYKPVVKDAKAIGGKGGDPPG